MQQDGAYFRSLITIIYREIALTKQTLDMQHVYKPNASLARFLL
jgi:hypothetical protein